MHSHNLALVYTGMGLAGIAMGCTYVPPIQALIEWFPDRKGLASGATVAGFGSGALFFAPAMTTMAEMFSHRPTFVGASSADVQCSTIDGKLFADVGGGQLKEVVLATGNWDIFLQNKSVSYYNDNLMILICLLYTSPSPRDS